MQMVALPVFRRLHGCGQVIRILTIHNFTENYAFGGEGNAFESEFRLLRNHGYEVV